MKKITKQALIWSSVALGLGGLTAGIAIPIIKDHEKRSNISPTNLTGDEEIFKGGPTLQSKMDADKDTIEIKNQNLLSKTEHQMSFFLYDEEQKASLTLQKQYFEWHKHEVFKNLKDFYTTTLGESVADVPTTGTIDEKYAAFIVKVQDKITLLADNDAKKSKQRTFDDMKKDWTHNLEKITAITNNTVNYGDSRFSEKYPKVLLPLDKIRSRHQGIYNDQKQAFVKSAATTDAGERQWFANLSKRYHGATTEAQAVDGLVFNEIKNKAYSRFQYSIDSSFTYEQFKSGVFKDFLGDETTDIAHSLSDNGIAIKATPKDTDKIFFLASKSNVATWLNPVKGKKLEDNHLDQLTRSHNAILGFKQDKTDVHAPWTADKNMLVNLFSGFANGGTVNEVADVWKKIFTDADGTGSFENTDTERLVQSYSLTTDSTQSRSGDLGLSTILDSFGPMAPGYALGLLSALHDMQTPTPTQAHVFDGSAAFGPTGSKVSFLTYLMDKLKAAFTAWTTKNGIALIDLPTVTATGGGTPTATDMTADNLLKIKEHNRQVKDIITNKMTDADIKATFGTVIRDAFNEAGALAGNNKEGIPLSMKIAPNVYLVVSEKYGVHVVKFETVKAATAATESLILTKLKEELKTAVEKQNTKDIATNYAGLLLKTFTPLGRLAAILDVKDVSGTPTVGNTDLLDYLKAHKEALDYTDDNIADLGNDIAKLITDLRHSEYLTDVTNAVKDATIKWLNDKLDHHLIVDDVITMKPEDIYNIALAVGDGV